MEDSERMPWRLRGAKVPSDTRWGAHAVAIEAILMSFPLIMYASEYVQDDYVTIDNHKVDMSGRGQVYNDVTDRFTCLVIEQETSSTNER